ncbi:PKD domain-containing protein [Cryobacterium sp. TMT1-21]|uniref:lamin tail domain-containing protein n=1 Tax=unclassified Cryobacterium TaxID=2649013 RepID=UPI00106986E2|nr:MULTISPECIES: lamin tail domain-containing protein [unclassified Cryobacterium]TFC87368.1 PKD domain-containing protein [Cryobacterium sp. TmT2-59]TFD17194.1 PKD domain-containing protein [Cryobacterium sp. TMT1-21]
MTAGRVARGASIAVVLATIAGSVLVATPAFAEPGGVVISEINYHAASDLDADDWFELTNTSSSAIDVSGWTITDAVTATFPAGSTIPAHGYFVVAANAVQFQTTNGFAPNAVYGALTKLKNSTGIITVKDASAATVDTVTYSDAGLPGWPASPDGTGPTLELSDLLSDNTQAASWGASAVNLGTPGKVNSINGAGPTPEITEVTATPARPAPNEPITVSARLKPGSSANLVYKVMFGADASLPFRDDAASPGGAGDGVYSATISGQAAGNLVRYRIEADAAGVAYSLPADGASIRYLGVVVTSGVSTQLPVIEWFMADSVYNDILANHRTDDFQGAAVWSYNGQVIDNALMNVRGNTSRTAAKVNWKVELPKGYTFDLGGALPYPLDEFALQNYSDNFADVSWATVRAAGNRGLNILPVRTQRNGAFWSLGRIMETMDGSWRDAQGVSDWAIYKGDAGSLGATSSPAVLEANAWLDKKTRKSEDFTDAWTLSNTVDANPSAAQQAWIYKNVNVPELVNYMATNSIIRHQDSGWYNWWIARDTAGTGRWEMWQWDLNWTFTTPASDGKGLFLTPDTSNNFTQAMLAYPEIKEMFYRHLRTLADQFLPPGQYEAQWDAITSKTQADWNLDRAKWGGYTPASARTAFLAGLADRRNAINNNTGTGKPVPTSQSANAAVVINEIMHSAANTGGDWLELANPGTTAVDISGWKISNGVNLTIQPGTVIPAGGRMVFVENDKAFSAAYPTGNRLVGGEFVGDLSGDGEALTLMNGANVVDTVTYGATAPWPAATGGPSLELVSPTADNADPANWRATSTTGGTPGLVNTAGGTPTNTPPTAAFTATPNGLGVSVDGSTSSDPNGSVTGYSWNWGDNTAAGTGVTATHTYATAGTYTVTLTVTDNGGATGTTIRSVTVGSVTPPAGTALAQDSFTRSSTNGFGTAETGGAWTVSGTASNFAVSGGTANITLPRGSNRFAYLASVSSSDTEVRATVGFPRQSASSNYVGLIGRRVGTATYGTRAVIGANGSVQLQLVRNTDIQMRAVTVAGLTYATGDRLQFRLQVTGTSPTTIQAKVWKVGTAEPANWQATVTDATAGLQSAGSIGLYSYLSSSATPTSLVVSFDDLWAGATGSAPTEPPATNAAPTAEFTGTPNGLAASFDGSASKDSDGTVASYAWDFGDGTTATTATPTTSHTYGAGNTYQVSLIVKDDKGATSAPVTHPVTVTGPVTPPPPGPAAFATDAFGRTTTNGFGSADTGGAWTVTGTASDFAVNGGTGTVNVAAGAIRTAVLGGVSSTSTDLTASVAFPRPTASSVYVGVIGRQVGTNSYGARVVVGTTGAVQLQLVRNNDQLIGSTIATGVTLNTGDRLQFRVQVTGTAPTTIQAKVWKAGAAEPATWQGTQTDNTAGLQSAGSLGLYTYLSRTGMPAPMTISWDDLRAAPTA